MNLPTSRFTPLHEAALVFAAATIFGFAYTAASGKGLFGPAASGAHARTFPSISFEEARAIHARGEAIFLDSRPSVDFGLGRIPGAVNLPLQDFQSGGPILDLLPRDQPLVTYCDGEDCNSSLELAAKLDSAGYRNVKVFYGGWQAWTGNGQPTEP